MNRFSRKFAYTYNALLRLCGIPKWELPVVLPNGYDIYQNNPKLQHLFAIIDSHTLVDRNRIAMLWQFALSTRDLNGDVAEVGVYKGGTARLLAEVYSDLPKSIYLFDTFGGMPETLPDKDWHKAGDFSDTTLLEVQDLMKGFPKAEIRKGFFPDTAKGLEDSIFSFVHIDADIYKSVWDSCDFFYKRLVSGGVMIFDDYGFTTCPGAKEAVDAFFKDKPEIPIYLKTFQAFVVKR